MIKSVFCKCAICATYIARTETEIVGQLPSDRFIPNRPFSVFGVYLCGPFEAKCGYHRSKIRFKVYLCIFVF